MEFAYSPKSRQMIARVQAFMHDYIVPFRLGAQPNQDNPKFA
ncbi:hypothetical protein SAMN05216421_0612 [Halopseudomonas xinjiangensis]|uniref:Acyl-CoA dehydrogenase n=1 Tax=Halopseudomonas xinjiangensis TaxID=487184 RepID=A0A1H1N5L1_9GAMM|nr:hypothetical protein [Halopseudomonas xinjiangensis]SDR94292.1 hypothetical protein SAMN05216421_0612 [Halopseudomonas xinjiangensis]